MHSPTAAVKTSTAAKKLRFRGDFNSSHSRCEELYERRPQTQMQVKKDDGQFKDSNSNIGSAAIKSTTSFLKQQHQHQYQQQQTQQQQQQKPLQKNDDNRSETSEFLDFFKVEMTRGYILQHDEERYAARRQKIYSFMRIPRDLERFMIYGIMQCADSFLYIHTFLPVRLILALWSFTMRLFAKIFRLRRSNQRLLMPAETCDLLKGSIWLIVSVIMFSVDTNRVYHIIKSQSIIKLYIFYNMLEVGDRLLSAFGQDSIDALFWTATESKDSKKQHYGLFSHIIFALIYVLLHSILIMFQATTLNVAVNSNNKGLLTIMISNNFVELKGSVFKKFDKNNLFQLTCSDVRERFQLTVLLFIVMIQTMKEFDWSLMQLIVMLPDCGAVLFTEVVIDWVKHAFITRFNELPEYIYREYTTSLAYDMTQTRQKHAFSDHSDLVARRMGFIPFPLSVILTKAIYTAVSFENLASWILLIMSFAFILGLRIFLTICALGIACKLMKEHQEERNNSQPSSMTNVSPVGMANNVTTNLFGVHSNNNNNSSSASSQQNTANNSMTTTATRIVEASTPMFTRQKPLSQVNQCQILISTPKQQQQQQTQTEEEEEEKQLTNEIELDVTNSLELGATALFSNSDVDLDDVCLNENVTQNGSTTAMYQEEELAKSEPDLPTLNKPECNSTGTGISLEEQSEIVKRLPKRTHKRSESEPSIQTAGTELNGETQA